MTSQGGSGFLGPRKLWLGASLTALQKSPAMRAANLGSLAFAAARIREAMPRVFFG
jgi:hypothetical protein